MVVRGSDYDASLLTKTLIYITLVVPYMAYWIGVRQANLNGTWTIAA